jgi:sec-independent protein translocase protein TatA
MGPRGVNDEGPSAVLDFSPIQILIVLVIALIVFGPKRLPEMGRSIGRGLREFRGAITDDGSSAPARTPEPARPPAAPGPASATATPAVATPAVVTPEEDDILEGIVVPGDTPPGPAAPPGPDAPPRAPDA